MKIEILSAHVYICMSSMLPHNMHVYLDIVFFILRNV
jgi:hypothetical protein